MITTTFPESSLIKPHKKTPQPKDWRKRLETVEFGFDVDGKKLESFITDLLKESVEAERKSVTKLVDNAKKEIYKLKSIRTVTIGDENLDLITKYQAVNMINLSGLPYTSIMQEAVKGR